MLKLCVDPFWSQDCLGFHIQAQPDHNTINKLIAIQSEFEAVSPVLPHLIPASALHTSVVTLVSAFGQVAEKEKTWIRIQKEMAGKLEEMARQSTFIPITFEHLKLTTSALIISTEKQPKPIADLRAQFSELLTRLGLPVPIYDRTHITLARFAAQRNLCQTEVEAIERLSLNLHGGFCKLRPVRERRYPSLIIDEL